MKAGSYNSDVAGLTRQERRVVGIVLLLLLTGWAVKTYRAARAPAAKPDDAAPGTRVIQPANR